MPRLMDGRWINDVKVTEDARYAIATNEGASDRKNGIVILDLADPAESSAMPRRAFVWRQA